MMLFKVSRMLFIKVLLLSILAVHAEILDYASAKQPLQDTKNEAKKEHIINGRESDISEFPYQVSIRASGSDGNNSFLNSHICGGAIISDRHILTAAHCTPDCIKGRFGEPIHDYFVASGSSSSLSGERHNVIHVRRHPEYFSATTLQGMLLQIQNDIAILTLEIRILFNKNQIPIELPKTDVQVDVPAIITGWGKTSSSSSSSLKLNSATLRTMSSDECRASIPYFPVYNSTTTICATYYPEFNSKTYGACQGDSGGPLASDNVLVGITSFGSGLCNQAVPDLFTRVYQYLSFINEIIEKDKQELLKTNNIFDRVMKYIDTFVFGKKQC